jgi:hypothetical protein
MLSGVQQKCYLILTFLGRQEWFMGVPIARGDGDGEDAEHDREDEGRGHVELPVIEAVQHLGFGRTVVSETEAPNMLVNLV